MKYLVKNKKSKQNRQEQQAVISTLVWLLPTKGVPLKERFTVERETVNYMMVQSLYI